MDIKEKKFLERDIFKKLRNSSSTFERRNVEINVEIYLKSFFKKNSKKKYVGIYWPLKNEIDLRGLKGKYLLALPRCKTDKKLLFCSWNNDRLTKDHEGIFAPDSSNKLSFDEIGIIFVPCLAVDKNLIRLGYGGGYFDVLRQYDVWRAIPCIGLLTSNCVSDNLLAKGDWDIPLTGYITDKEIFV